MRLRLQLVDTDGSGEMDRQEFDSALEMMHIEMTPQEMDLAFNEIDEDKGGTIEVRHFSHFCSLNCPLSLSLVLNVLNFLRSHQIEEFMTRMRREKKWKKEDQDHEVEMDANEKEARFIESLTGEAKQIAIENAGNSAWELARMRMQLEQWKEDGTEAYEDADYAAYQKEELEAQLAEAAHAKEEEEARLAEEEHAKEEQEAQEAEERLAVEEKEAEQALEDAKREELEAKLAADKAEKEMREAIAAEKKAARERAQASEATKRLEKERQEADEAKSELDLKIKILEEFIDGPLAAAKHAKSEAWHHLQSDASITAHDSGKARHRRGSQVDMGDWVDDGKFSKADVDHLKQMDIVLQNEEEKKKILEEELEIAKAKADKELAEAVEAEQTAIKETFEAEEAERIAKIERQEALEAQDNAAQEKAEAVEARALAQKEVDEVAEARQTAERERREADEARATAQREREEADEAHVTAKRERAEADAAKYKYYSKLALQFGQRWRATAKTKGKARRREKRRLRKEMIAAAPPTDSGK